MVGIDRARPQLSRHPAGDSTVSPEPPAGGEFAVIERLRARLPVPPEGETWIGDDAAVVESRPTPLLLTTDMAVAGVHGDLGLMGLDDLGWRAVAAAVSDIAAMGGRALHVLVAAAGPPSTDLDTLLDGVVAAVTAHGATLVGGDLSNAPEVVVAVTVTGLVADSPGAVRRSGAKPGDHLLVTGALGASAAGLRVLRAGRTAAEVDETDEADEDADAPEEALVRAHRRPRARLAEGEAARLGGASAMIDVSDGLAADLDHLARASAVGIRLDDIPVAAGATVEEALGGGEDYELVFAAPDTDAVNRSFADAGLSEPLVMGVCTTDPTERTFKGQPLATTGWEHRWS
jgi:thiamine-monophosphate kinase